MELISEDKTGALSAEEAAQQRRAGAFRGAREWKGKPLKWTSSRDTYYYWLRTPGPRLSDAARSAVREAKEAEGTEQYAELARRAEELVLQSQAESGPNDVYYRNALIILFLAVHGPRDWQAYSHDRARFLTAIEEWADEHVSLDEVMQVAEVTNELLADAESTRAIVRPSGRGAGGEEGNLPSP